MMAFNPDLVPREDLIRFTPRVPVLGGPPAPATPAPSARAVTAPDDQAADAADQDAPGRPVMFGHFLLFDTWTEIDSWWEGRFKERIADGAIKKTIRESGPRGANTIQVLYDHGMDYFVGNKPLGPIRDLLEDDLGGYGEVTLSDTSYNADLEQLIRDQAIRGQSFRFSVVKEDWDKVDTDMPERTIRELRLYEWGPVTFPAYAATSVGVRSRGQWARWQQLDAAQRQRLQTSVSRFATAERAAGRAVAPATAFDAAADTLTEPPARHSASHAMHMRARLHALGLNRR